MCEVSLVQHERPAIEDDRVTVVCHQTLCAFVCVYGVALRAVMSSAEPPPGPGGPVSQIVSCGCLDFLQQEHILADLIRRVKHSGSGLKCVVDMLSGNEAYFLIFFFLDLFHVIIPGLPDVICPFSMCIL